MSKYTFIQEDDFNTKVTYETETVSLPDLLESFNYFLKGCSFHFNGYVDLVEDDETKEPEKIESTFHVI